MNQRAIQTKAFQKPLMYRVVFGVVYTKWLVAVMFGFFLFHPTVPVFAADTEVAAVEQSDSVSSNAESASESAKSESESEPAEDSPPTKVVTPDDNGESAEPDVVIEDVAPIPLPTEVDTVETELAETEEVIDGSGTNIDAIMPNDEPAETIPSNNVDSPPEVPATTISTTTPSSTDETPIVPDVDTSTSTPTSSLPDLPQEAPEVIGESPTAPEVMAAEPEPEPVATTTIEKEIIYITTNEATNDANRHSFGVNECVSVGGSSYYCHETDGGETLIADNGVYAAPDNDGDHEIFFRHYGEVTQLTHNSHDDRAPYFDTYEQQVVFHRLIDGRYQIFNYDLGLKHETQLTFTDENSMEPAQGDGVTVWQEWVGDNWEIAALIDGEVKLLSESVHNDVAPSIKDGYVMWHTMDTAGNKLLSVYEIESGQASIIVDPEGGQVSNPRYVLVYDTTFNNGDTITKTYDPETGAIQHIAAESGPVPVKPVIPEPEPAGEAGAIINLKPTTRDAESEGNDLAGGGGEPVGDDEVATSSPGATEPDTVGASTTKSFEIDLSIATSTTLELSEFDLIVEPFSSSSSAQQSDSVSSSDNVE